MATGLLRRGEEGQKELVPGCLFCIEGRLSSKIVADVKRDLQKLGIEVGCGRVNEAGILDPSGRKAYNWLRYVICTGGIAVFVYPPSEYHTGGLFQSLDFPHLPTQFYQVRMSYPSIQRTGMRIFIDELEALFKGRETSGFQTIKRI